MKSKRFRELCAVALILARRIGSPEPTARCESAPARRGGADAWRGYHSSSRKLWCHAGRCSHQAGAGNSIAFN